MVDHAGVIALVTVSEVQSTEELDAIPFTNYGVSVDEWIAVSRSDQAKSKEIVVRQLGAIAKDGSVVVADDDPLLIKAERAIVFLREFAPGQFVIQGGPTGRLQIRGGEAHRVGGGSWRQRLSPSPHSWRQLEMSWAPVEPSLTQ